MLAGVSSSALQRLQAALESGRVACPPTRDALVRAGIRSQPAAIERAFASLDAAGCRAVIDAVLTEREAQEVPPPELVWTGPEGAQATARDTAVVLAQLFSGARERVVLAGYRFLNPDKVLKPLHRVMVEHGVRVVMLVDVPQPKAGEPRGAAWGQAQLARFLEESWPFGAPCPELHCDVRALSPAPPWCSLHAKCASVDGTRAYLSSANFTERGQERNIEAGVLVHDAPFALQLERQWQSLIDGGLTYRYRPGEGEGPAATAPATTASVPTAPVVTASDVAVRRSASTGFEELYPITREPDALASLAERGVPAPDEAVMDIELDGENVACAEWCWSERRIALLVEGTVPEAERRLRESGWRTVPSTDERHLRQLVDWLGEEGA